MKKTSVSLLAAVAALSLAGTASAQVCAGFPTMDGQFSLAAVANFPEDIDEFGVEGSYNTAGPIALNAGYIRNSFGDDASANTFQVGVSFDVTSLEGPAPAAISLCPTVQFGYTTYSESDDATGYTVPVGLGFGTSLPLGATTQLQPYVIPQIVFGKLDVDGLDNDWENEFGLRAGANVTFGMFFVGGEVRKIFEEGNDAVFGVKAGIRI